MSTDTTPTEQDASATDGVADRSGGAADEQVRDAQGRLVVDALGMACPRPILELAQAIKPLPIGDVVLLLADDPATKVDVPAWARMKRQQVVSLDEDERGELRIVVAKRSEV